MCSGGSHTPLRVRGFPIRISTDRRLVGTFPWLIAASHVLHRFLSPRHSPLALRSLGIRITKMLVLAMKFSRGATARRTRRGRRARARSLGAGEAYLHNGRQDGHPGHTPYGSRAQGRVPIRMPASASTGCPCPAHSVMLHEPDGLDSLERR